MYLDIEYQLLEVTEWVLIALQGILIIVGSFMRLSIEPFRILTYIIDKYFKYKCQRVLIYLWPVLR